MKSERTKVEFPLWRKKVDKSLFEQGTTIPNWACQMWNIPSLFSGMTSRKHDCNVTIDFQGKRYSGSVTEAAKSRANPAFRIFYDNDLILALRDTFLMSYMRSLEQSLAEDKKGADIEEQIPFWEFLDIEFDESLKHFKFVAHYTQQPSFPRLFKRLVGSPALSKIYDEVEGKDKSRINKTDWRRREELQYEMGAQNVIYTLVDTDAELVYIGEAQNLIKRLTQSYQSIPNWNYFRYDVLPSPLASYRVTLERMLIRGLASLLPNKKGVDTRAISNYRLANDKIDK